MTRNDRAMALMGAALVVNLMGCIAFEQLAWVAGSTAILIRNAVVVCAVVLVICALVGRASRRAGAGLAGLCRECFGRWVGGAVAVGVAVAACYGSGLLLGIGSRSLDILVPHAAGGQWRSLALDASLLGVVLSAGWWNWRRLAGMSAVLLAMSTATIYGAFWGVLAPIPRERVNESALGFPVLILLPLLLWSCNSWRFESRWGLVASALLVGVLLLAVALASAWTVAGAVETGPSPKAVRDYLSAVSPRWPDRNGAAKVALFTMTLLFPVRFVLHESREAVRTVAGAPMGAILPIVTVWVGLHWYSILDADIYSATAGVAAVCGVVAGSAFGDRRRPVVAAIALAAGLTAGFLPRYEDDAFAGFFTAFLVMLVQLVPRWVRAHRSPRFSDG